MAEGRYTGRPQAKGTLADSNPFQIVMYGASIPATVVLNSSSAGRSIQYQAAVDHPEILSPVTPDVTLTAQIQAVNNSPVYAVWITGQAGDTYEVLS